jgi:hypothetical protein
MYLYFPKSNIVIGYSANYERKICSPQEVTNEDNFNVWKLGTCSPHSG